MMMQEFTQTLTQIYEIRIDQKQEIRLKNKSIHQRNWNIEDYCKIFRIPEDKLLCIIKWFNRIIDIPNGKENIRVLSPGVGAGRNELILILSLTADDNNSKKVICDFVDYSEKSCAHLKEILLDSGFEEEENESIFRKDNIQINIIIQDYEIWLKGNKEKKYDVILSFFLFNFLSNWRESILSTIQLLNDHGILLVSQDLGDLCYLDNTYYEIPDKSENDRYDFYKLWADYYDIRKKYGLDWNNLISPSDMTFVETCFSDIHQLTNQKTDISKEVSWNLNDIRSDDSQEEFEFFKYWVQLIIGNNESDEVFNCLDIPNMIIDANGSEKTQLREEIARDLCNRENYDGEKKVGNLKLGEKLFYLKKPTGVENFDNICRYVFKRNNFDISSVSKYRFNNRYDRLKDIQKVPLRFSLLNRALDVYNCFIHDKDKSMVSMFSKDIKLDGNRFQYSWRQEGTPIVYPAVFSSKEYCEFVISYALYFYFRTQEDYKEKLTDIIHGEFPNRIGLIFKLVDENEGENFKENVCAIYYKNTQNVKAFIINLSKEKFLSCQSELKKIVTDQDFFKTFSEKLEKEYYPNNNFFYTEKLIQLKKSFSEKGNGIGELLKDLEKKFELNDSNRISNDTIKYFNNNNEEIEGTLRKKLSTIFNSIYLIALSHPVDCNVIIYTTTNIDYSKESAENLKEQSYYGLIVADKIQDLGERYINNYYDQLLSNTFSYSGMDGIHEQRAKDEMTELSARKAAISQVMARNMSHNMGSHVLSRMITKEDVSSNFGWENDQYEPIDGLNEIDQE